LLAKVFGCGVDWDPRCGTHELLPFEYLGVVTTYKAVTLNNIPRCSEIPSSVCGCDVVTSLIYYTQGLILPIPSQESFD